MMTHFCERPRPYRKCSLFPSMYFWFGGPKNSLISIDSLFLTVSRKRAIRFAYDASRILRQPKLSARQSANANCLRSEESVVSESFSCCCWGSAWISPPDSDLSVLARSSQAGVRNSKPTMLNKIGCGVFKIYRRLYLRTYKIFSIHSGPYRSSRLFCKAWIPGWRWCGRIQNRARTNRWSRFCCYKNKNSFLGNSKMRLCWNNFPDRWWWIGVSASADLSI